MSTGAAAEEQVLVIPRSTVMGDPGWLGVRTDGLDAFDDLVARAGRFVARSIAERDRSTKQVVPYLVLRDGPRTFLMRRTRAGSDARLHDRYSIGVGGHLNPGDVDLAHGLRREWLEELEATFVPDFQLIGLLNDDTTDVGSVHIGAVYVAEAAGRPVRIRETDKLSGAFATVAEVGLVVELMETWSRLVFEHLQAAGPAAGSAVAPISGGMARGG